MRVEVDSHSASLSERFVALINWRPGKLAKGTLAMTAGMGLRTVAQTGVFLIVARVLGVEGYGTFAAVLALAGALGGLGGLGTQALLVRDVARNSETFPAAWGRALAAIVVSAPMLFGIYLLLAWAVLPAGVSAVVIGFIGLAELVFAPLALAAINAYQGHERIGRAARLVLTPLLSRLAGALSLLPLVAIVPVGQRLETWSVLYAFSALAAAVYSLRLVRCDLGHAARPNWSSLHASLRAGLPFAFAGVASKLHSDIDKTMLARLATLEAAGVYSAGYRVVDMVNVPLRAMLTATAPRFFRAGGAGTGSAVAYALRVSPLPLAYASAMGAILYLMADLLPWVLGPEYSKAVQVVQYLAWLPLVSMPRLFLQMSMVTAGYQGQAVTTLVAGALANITLNLWLIPAAGWRGAAIATYGAEVIMTVAMWLSLWLAGYRGDENPE